MNTVEIISRVLKNSADDMPPGQGWNLDSEAACNMLAEKVHDALQSRNLLANIVPPINPDSNK